MSNRKYTTEFGLNLVSANTALLQQDKLGEIDRLGLKPHVYIVARRPRITVVPESIQFSNTAVTGHFQRQIGQRLESIPFAIEHKWGTEDLSLQSAYPFTAFKIILNATGTTVLSGKCAMLLYSCGPLYWQHLDLEVLYVGQAFGADGSRTAADRLGNHETLQAIYAETMRLSPDQDIWLFLTEFTEFMMVMIDGKDKNVVVSEDEDSAHIHQVVHSEISEQQAINFGEAALIRFFAPRYNKRFKDTFPNPAHKTYAECYDLDLNMVSVELDTEDAGFRFWSDKVEPQWAHYCSFALHNREERRYMFELEDERLL